MVIILHNDYFVLIMVSFDSMGNGNNLFVFMNYNNHGKVMDG